MDVAVSGGDDAVRRELESVLGGGSGGATARLGVELEDRGEWVEVGFETDVDLPDDAEDLRLGLLSNEFPFRLLAGEPDEMRLAFGDEPEPLLVLRGKERRIRKHPEWRRALALLVFHRLLRTRREAIFFHAATLGIDGRGLMLIGPKGAGKSTTALALAARGHSLLGDETAGYVPETGLLLPVRRPVGIKPGVRARAVERSLDALDLAPERDGVLRLDVERLLPLPDPEPVPLRAVVFLSGFEARHRLEAIPASREEVAQLQPIVGSLVNASPLRRVFEMSKMLSRARTFRLWLGTPEDSAEALEQAVRS